MMRQGKVHIPPAWLAAALRGDWSAPQGMAGEWQPTVLRFRVDEGTFAEFAREVREEENAK